MHRFFYHLIFLFFFFSSFHSLHSNLATANAPEARVLLTITSNLIDLSKCANKADDVLLDFNSLFKNSPKKIKDHHLGVKKLLSTFTGLSNFNSIKIFFELDQPTQKIATHRVLNEHQETFIQLSPQDLTEEKAQLNWSAKDQTLLLKLKNIKNTHAQVYKIELIPNVSKHPIPTVQNNS